jgi:DNA primase
MLWLGNQASLELHPAPVRVDMLERPDLLVVDIDPSGPAVILAQTGRAYFATGSDCGSAASRDSA